MTTVCVRCIKTRYVANDHYSAGETYEMDAERAGKYTDCFVPASQSDAVEAKAAWEARLAKDNEERAIRRELDNVDPSIVKAAIQAIQGEIAKAAQAKVSGRAALNG